MGLLKNSHNVKLSKLTTFQLLHTLQCWLLLLNNIIEMIMHRSVTFIPVLLLQILSTERVSG